MEVYDHLPLLKNLKVKECDVIINNKIVNNKMDTFFKSLDPKSYIYVICPNSVRAPDVSTLLKEYTTCGDIDAWIEVMPMVIYFHCYTKDADAIIEILENNKLECSKRDIEHIEYVDNYNVQYDMSLDCIANLQYLFDHDVVKLNLTFSLSTFKDPKNLNSLTNTNVLIMNSAPFRDDAYCDFSKGSRLIIDNEKLSLDDVNIENPLITTPWHTHVIEFPTNIVTMSGLLFRHDIRRKLTEQRLNVTIDGRVIDTVGGTQMIKRDYVRVSSI
jgi:hypothetical protein